MKPKQGNRPAWIWESSCRRLAKDQSYVSHLRTHTTIVIHRYQHFLKAGFEGVLKGRKGSLIALRRDFYH